MNKQLKNQGSSLIGILIAMLIIAGLTALFLKGYEEQKNKKNNSFIDSNIDTTNYLTIIDSAKNIIKKAEDSRQRIP